MRRLFATLLSLPLLAGGGGTVAFHQHSFLAEVAVTEAEQMKGLMYRQSVPKDRCMIFIYREDGYHSIWMKNCLTALDVVWVDADGRVVESEAHVPPCSPMRGDDCPTYGGTLPARHFIEFAPGTLKRIGLKKGDRLGWDLTLDDGRHVTGGAALPKRKNP